MAELYLPAMISSLRSETARSPYRNADHGQEQRHQEQLMWSMRTMGSLLQRGDLAASSREHIQRTLLSVFGSLPQNLRPGAASLLQAAHLSPEEMKLEAFRASHAAPTPPVDKDGVPLPKTTENEGIWASFYFDAAKHKKAAITYAFGKEVSDTLQTVPKLLQVNPESKNLWAQDKQTGFTMPVSLEAMNVDLEQAAKRGWTLSRIASAGGVVTQDYKDIIIGGREAKVAPFKDFETGKMGVDVEFYGEEKGKSLAKPLHDAFVAAAMGEDAIANLSGASRNLAQLMTEVPKTFNKAEDLKEPLQKLQKVIEMYDPNAKVFPDLEGDDKVKGKWTGFLPFVNSYKVEGLPFTIVSTEGKGIFIDANGNEGELWRARTPDGKTILVDNKGQPIPSSIGKDESDILEDVTFATEPAEEIRQGTFGDVFSNMQSLLNEFGKVTKQTLKPDTRKEVMQKTKDYITLLSKELDMTEKDILNFDKTSFIEFVGEAVESAKWPLDAYLWWVKQIEEIPIPGYKVEVKKQ